MFAHWFAYIMVGTFVAAALTMVAGVAGIGNGRQGVQASTLMLWRVALSFLLLVEILVYVNFIKPTL